MAHESSTAGRLETDGRVWADGLATGAPGGVEVMLTLPLPGRDGSGVLGLSVPNRTLAEREVPDAGDALYARYREYTADGVVAFDNEGIVSGPFAIWVDPWDGVTLEFTLTFEDSRHASARRVLSSEGYFLRMLGDAPGAGGSTVEAGGEIVLGVGDDGYDDYDGYDGYAYGDSGGGCDGDDWGGGDSYDSGDSGGGCEGDDVDSGGGCDSDAGGGGGCDCEGDALASGSGRRSPLIARAFNWAPWLLIVGFLHGMRRRRRFSARRW